MVGWFLEVNATFSIMPVILWGTVLLVEEAGVPGESDDFNFPIMNVPFICSMISAAPAYGVYISQLIRYSRACISYQDFLIEGCC